MGIIDNLHRPQSPFGQTDTFSFRVMLLSVYDEMLRGVSEETLCPLFLLPCKLGRCPSYYTTIYLLLNRLGGHATAVIQVKGEQPTCQSVGDHTN